MSKRWVAEHFRLPLAEHGFSVLIRTFDNSKSHTILFDTGVSPEGVVINAKRMGLNLSEVEAKLKLLLCLMGTMTTAEDWLPSHRLSENQYQS